MHERYDWDAHDVLKLFTYFEFWGERRRAVQEQSYGHPALGGNPHNDDFLKYLPIRSWYNILLKVTEI